MGMHTVTAIKAAHTEQGGNFFEPATMQFFNSRVLKDAWPLQDGRCIFITSEKGPNGVRAYTVRIASHDARWVETAHGQMFMQHETLGAAKKAAARLAAELNEGVQ